MDAASRRIGGSFEMHFKRSRRKLQGISSDFRCVSGGPRQLHRIWEIFHRYLGFTVGFQRISGSLQAVSASAGFQWAPGDFQRRFRAFQEDFGRVSGSFRSFRRTPSRFQPHLFRAYWRQHMSFPIFQAEVKAQVRAGRRCRHFSFREVIQSFNN